MTRFFSWNTALALCILVGCSKSKPQAPAPEQTPQIVPPSPPSEPATAAASPSSLVSAPAAPVSAPKPEPKSTPFSTAIRTLQSTNRLDCASLSQLDVMGWSECSDFQAVIDSGRTAGHRKGMLAAMKRHGYVKLRGRIVALVAQNTYEVTARKKHSRYRRALLVTRSFRYTTTGGYRLWVRRIGERWITTTRGASQNWPIFEENRVGIAYSKMRKARAGEQTSERAKRLAMALIRTQLHDSLSRK